MASPIPLAFDQVYHVYNRGTNREDLFVEDRNYRHFLQLYIKHIEPVAETYAYCLLRNHFHVLVRIRAEEEQKALQDPRVRVPRVLNPSQRFGNLFNAYAKAFNKAYGRTGSLFQHPFGRVPVLSDAHLTQLVIYIHRNPERHGLCGDFAGWAHSSYRSILSTSPTRLGRDEVLGWFQGREGFVAAHLQPADEKVIAALVGDDER